MKKKLVGIFVCMLLIATAIPTVTSLKNSAVNATVPSTPKASMTGGWTEGQKLLASDGAANDNFGIWSAIDGDTALIGAYGDDNYEGSVYVFTRTGTTWTQQAKLLASDGAAGDEFGQIVSLDGDTAIIGALYDDDNGADSGSAYVFTRTGTTWTQQAKLLPSDGAAGDQFGTVSLFGDTAFISARSDDDNGAGSGSMYVFTRTGSTWTQQQKLTASDGAAGDWFGAWVSLSVNTALIGAPLDDGNKGSVYVFTLTGTTWTQQQKLTASDGAAGDWFGYPVSLDGDTALIGAWNDDDNGVDSGSAYVYTRAGTTWTQQAKLLPSDGAAGDQFGIVSLYGETALIGAWLDDDNGDDSGSAYVFTRTGTSWTQQQKLTASDGAAGDRFGLVSIDGDTAILTALFNDDKGVDSGSAYVFIKTTENQPPVAAFSWTPQNPKPKQLIVFDASASHDPDGDVTLYEWDWDNDGTFEESDTSPIATHTWNTAGSYPVTLRVTDNSSATGTLTKTVHVNDTIEFNLKITGGFGIKAAITNNGSITATQLKWTFTLTKGFILLGKTKSGTITSLVAGDSTTVKDIPILGFGKTNILLNVTCAEGYSGTQSAVGSMFLFFVGVK